MISVVKVNPWRWAMGDGCVSGGATRLGVSCCLFVEGFSVMELLALGFFLALRLALGLSGRTR